MGLPEISRVTWQVCYCVFHGLFFHDTHNKDPKGRSWPVVGWKFNICFTLLLTSYMQYRVIADDDTQVSLPIVWTIKIDIGIFVPMWYNYVKLTLRWELFENELLAKITWPSVPSPSKYKLLRSCEWKLGWNTRGSCCSVQSHFLQVIRKSAEIIDNLLVDSGGVHIVCKILGIIIHKSALKYVSAHALH